MEKLYERKNTVSTKIKWIKFDGQQQTSPKDVGRLDSNDCWKIEASAMGLEQKCEV